MKDPRTPDTSSDQYLADLPSSHAGGRPVEPVTEGINPQDPSSMPRAEDDEETMKHSPEFHDRPGSGAAAGRNKV
jgi:hypothetical protein